MTAPGHAGDQRLAALTEQVVASFAGASSPRYRTVMQSLVRHLHAFLAETSITEREWEQGIEFLTRAGHITDDKRQEFILLSDVLGASMATIAINHPGTDLGVTESTVLGPFFADASPRAGLGDDISGGAVGQPCYASGTVRDVAGRPVPGARIEIWEADADGFYDVQRAGGPVANRAHLFTDDQGGYRFWSVRPAPYPIPHDGPVGDLLTAAARGPMRPAHIHFMVSADGYQRLTTHVFADGDPYLGQDAVFGVKPSLIRTFARHPAGVGPGGRVLDTEWSDVEFDLVLSPNRPA